MSEIRKSRHHYFVEMLLSVRSRSTCLRRAVGAILVDSDGRILSTGYNGTPRGFAHCTSERPCAGAYDQKGDSSRCFAVHAEQNALLFCHRLDLAHTLYVTDTPCFTCAKLIAQTPIQRVVTIGIYPDELGRQILAGKLYVYLHEADDISLYSAI